MPNKERMDGDKSNAHTISCGPRLSPRQALCLAASVCLLTLQTTHHAPAPPSAPPASASLTLAGPALKLPAAAHPPLTP